MEKQVINVPGADALASTHTRLGFLTTLAAASVGAVAGSAVLTRGAQAQIQGSQEGDLGIANFALTLEFLERDFYQLALNAGVLSGSALGGVTNLRDHEAAHVNFLTTAIQGAGGTPTPEPKFNFPPDALASQAGVLNLASQLEPTGVGAYLGAGPMISDPNILESALSIYGTENDHVVAIKNLLGVDPPAQTAFESPLTKDQVLAKVAPFLGMGGGAAAGGGQLPSTGGPG